MAILQAWLDDWKQTTTEMVRCDWCNISAEIDATSDENKLHQESKNKTLISCP